MARYCFREQWLAGAVGEAEKWPEEVRSRVNLHQTYLWHRSCHLPTLKQYCVLKNAIAVEPWLCEYQDPQPRRLKLLARAGALELRPRLASVIKVPEDQRPQFNRCVCCRMAVTEDLPHFILHCPAYATLRDAMLNAIRSDLDAIGYLPVFVFLTDLANPEERRLAVLLGSTLPEPPPAHKATRDGLRNSQVQSCLHRRFSNFLMLAWRERERLMGFPVVVYDRELKQNVLKTWIQRVVGKRSEREAARGVKHR